MASGSSSSSSGHEEINNANHGHGDGGSRSSSGSEQKQQPNLPSGYKFAPWDCELVVHYLLNKILGRQLPVDIIQEFDVYNTDPQLVPLGQLPYVRRNEAYFFTHKDQNFLQGGSYRQANLGGIWKAVERDGEIFCGNKIVGYKSRFEFYRKTAGTEDEEERTNWVLTEFKVNPGMISESELTESVSSEAERLVACRVELEDADAAAAARY